MRQITGLRSAVRGRARPARQRHAAQRGIEMIQVALWGAAAVFIMAIIVAAIALFVHAEVNTIQPPANGGAGAVFTTGPSIQV